MNRYVGICIISVIALKGLPNLLKALRLKYLKFRYVSTFEKDTHGFAKFSSETKALIKATSIPNDIDSYYLERDEGVYSKITTSALDNLSMKNVHQYSKTKNLFDYAYGEYLHRAKQAISPIYWIDVIVFAPKHIIQYLGIDLTTVAPKVINLLLTFIWWVFWGFVALNRDFIAALISNLIQNYLK